jgi:cobyrinic acid a,c-diamide synthase
MMKRASSAFVIAGTQSGVGKTTVALAVMAALRRRGLRVQPFKVGPDFIDPGLHAEVCGVASYNLDGWMLTRKYNRGCFLRNMHRKDVGVVEGMMGLYDGRSGATDEGSTAEMAKLLRLPVILVVDVFAMARSVAALVHGYCRFDAKTRIAGVIFNRVAGQGHLNYLNEALRSLRGVKCFGGVPPQEQVRIPERHLGLMAAEEDVLDRRFIHRLATLAEDHLDLEGLLKRTRIAVERTQARPQSEPPSNEQVPIAVARDRGFCFYYPDNLELLRAAGAKLELFSPIADHDLPPGTKGVYLGGGYPELYASELARNRRMRRALRGFIEAGGPVYAECGGLMYLTKALIDGQKREHPMVGAYAFKSRMLPQLRALGYREVAAGRKAFIARGQKMRGHEFHYSELAGPVRVERVYSVRAAGTGESAEGYRFKNCLGSYVHVHFGSNPAFAQGFVDACRDFSSEKL